MNLDELIAYIDSTGIMVDCVNGKLAIKEPRPKSGLFTPDFMESIRSLKAELIEARFSEPEKVISFADAKHLVPQVPPHGPSGFSLVPEKPPEPIPDVPVRDPEPIVIPGSLDPGPFPHVHYYWRQATAFWPDHLRKRYGEFANHWLDKGYSNLWAEWRAWKGMLKIIADYESKNPDKDLGFRDPMESGIEEFPEWTASMTFPEMMESGIAYSRSVQASKAAIPKSMKEVPPRKPNDGPPKKKPTKRSKK